MTKKKNRLLVAIHSRANYGRIKSVLAAAKAHEDLELRLVVGSSALLYKYGQVVDLIEQDGFQIDAKVYSVIEGENPTTMAKSTGVAIMELATLFENLNPDVVLTVADRHETIATAIAASYMNIPLAHTQGGEVTGSIDESVRHAITKLSHIHFPATEQAANFLVRMGEDPWRVHFTGCPAIDVVADIDLAISRRTLNRYGGTGADIDVSHPYLVVLQHPVTTEFGNGLMQIDETLAAVQASGIPAIWLWPNVDAGSDEISKGLRLFREREPNAPIHFYRNFEIEDYARLIANCACLVGNSSSAIREGAFLGVPAVNIGTRQYGREHADNIRHAEHNQSDILEKIRAQVAHGQYNRSTMFGDGQAGERIVNVLAQVDDFKIQKTLNYK